MSGGCIGRVRYNYIDIRISCPEGKSSETDKEITVYTSPLLYSHFRYSSMTENTRLQPHWTAFFMKCSREGESDEHQSSVDIGSSSN